MMELLCPAGDKEALVAAVRNGADAVYLGGTVLNARRGAGNFDADGLRWAGEYCHERGVKMYVTVNTLVKEAELPELGRIAAELYGAQADAVIVQDIGAAVLLRKMLPHVPIHASTQMAVHNRHGVLFCLEQGYDRVVLAREMSDFEIKSCAGIGPELEVFVHGALCVACSGQCLFSSLVGGRSGNRGLCAQPCRLPYELRWDGHRAEGYLLSPKDLMQLRRLEELESMGVRSIKIEGRLKRPEYVAVVTRYYREMLDHPHEPAPHEIESLKQIFNRGGFTRGYGPGLIDSELMSHAKPNHCGAVIGKAVAKGKLLLSADVGLRDQLVIGDEPINLSGAAGETVVIPGEIQKGSELVRLADDAQLREARASYEGSEAPMVMLRGRLTLRVGEPMTLVVSEGKVSVMSQGAVVQRAERRGADEARVRGQIEKTGGTIYAFEQLDVDMDGDAFVPISELNALRRGALDEFRAQRIGAQLESFASAIGFIGGSDAVEPVRTGPRPLLRVQAADMALLAKAPSWGADCLVYAPRDISKEALVGLVPAERMMLSLPMVCSDEALMALNDWAWRHEDMLEGVIASNVGHLSLRWPGALDADFSMNVANTASMAALRELGVRFCAPSVELTAKEIAALGGDIELITYGRLPLMQLRHCPLNAQRQGAPHMPCRACDRDRAIDRAQLIDRKGVSFPLERLSSESGCIVRVLNSVPLMLLRHSRKLPRTAAWRVILGDETEQVAEAIVKAHRCAIDGNDIKSSQYWPIVDDMQTTTGHYFRGVE